MRPLDAHDIAHWVEHTLLAADRTRPVVAITSHHDSDRCWLDPDELQRELGDAAEVVCILTGDATWALSEALPPRLEVFGGAARIWWPGLRRDSDPHAHRLWLVFDAQGATRARREIVQAVFARSSAGPPVPSPTVLEPVADRAPALVTARVVSLSLVEIVLEADEHRGPVQESDVPIAALAAGLDIGSQLPARPLRRLPDGRWTFSLRGLLPDPWQRLAATVAEDDVIEGRVQAVNRDRQLAFIEVLPGVVGICPVREVDYEFVADIAAFLAPGSVHPFVVLTIAAADRRLVLSRRRAYGQQPRPSPSLLDGGRPFAWTKDMPLAGKPRVPPARRTATPSPTAIDAANATLASTRQQLDDLGAELDAANRDRQSLRDEIRRLRTQIVELKQERRSLEDRVQALQNAAADNEPFANERAFLRAVRIAHARLFDEGDRVQHPLQRMRVGADFLATVATTPGVDAEKLVDVCAQVAADIAHDVPGREVHPLRDGSRGAGDRIRKRDGARAWRCALHQGPSAPRLHWWNVPGDGGVTIEFANIGLHDTFEIPE